MEKSNIIKKTISKFIYLPFLKQASLNNNNVTGNFSFLKKASFLKERLQSTDWELHTLGNPQLWRDSLKTMLAYIAAAKKPMLLLYGPQYIVFYNDAWAAEKAVDTTHIGATAEKLFGAGWAGIRILADRVTASGESITADDIKVLNTNYTIEFTPFTAANGDVEGVIITTDKTVYSTGETASAPEVASLKDIIESAPFSIGIYSGPDMVISFANPALLGMWGKDSSVIGKKYADVMPELVAQQILRQLENVYQSGLPFKVNSRLLNIEKNGVLESVYISYSFIPLRDASGTIYAVMSTGADVTENTLAAQKKLDSEQRFRSVIEEAPVATCIFTGPELKIELANQKMISLWGKGATVMDKPLAKAVPELVGQPFIPILEEVYRTGIAHEERDAPADLVIDGVMSTYYFDYTYKPLFDANGKVYGIMDMAVDVTDKVVARRTIEQSQRQLLDLFEQSPVGIAIIDTNGLVFTMANSFYGELVGRKPEELLNKSLLEALPELDGQGFDKLLQEVIDTGIPYIAKEVAVTLLRNEVLETIYVDLAYQPKYQENKIYGIMVVVTDVTQQVSSRKATEESVAKLRSIIASAPAGIGLFVGRDLVVEMPNQTFIDIVGKGWDIVGKPLREAMPELLTEGQPFLKILDDVFTTGVMFQSPGAQVKIVQDGVMTYNYYNITYTPIFDENNEVYAILDIAVDVTDAVVARQQLEEAETVLRGAIENAELATWTYNIKTGTYNYSQRFMDWLGISDATKNLDEAYSPLPEDYRQQVVKKIQAAIAPGSDGIYQNEYPIINRLTGARMIIYAQAQVFYDFAGEPEILSGTARDITREREMQQHLENQIVERTEKLRVANANLAEANSSLQKSNRELGQFAYIASHDLQEPLRKISIFTKMLEENIADINDKSKMYISKILNSSERMTSLIKDILGYSRLSKEDEVFEEVNLTEIAISVSSDYEYLIDQKKATVDIRDLPVIKAVPLQMTQLFANLISNSLKYSREGVPPVISISAESLTANDQVLHPVADPSAYYKLVFQDNGIGFSQEYAYQIFNIFQRLHTKTEFSGTGIGLAMCKKIAQNHGGEIYAFSGEGMGARFEVIMPYNP